MYMMAEISWTVGQIVVLLVKLLFAFASVWALTKFLPWLSRQRVYSYVRKFVMAAEKMAEAGTINKCDKNAVVVDLLEKNGITVNETVRALIEAAVKELDLLEDKVVEWVSIHTNWCCLRCLNVTRSNCVCLDIVLTIFRSNVFS